MYRVKKTLFVKLKEENIYFFKELYWYFWYSNIFHMQFFITFTSTIQIGDFYFYPR